MKAKVLCEKLGLSIIAGNEYLNREIKSGYCCDLLSLVMSKADKGCCWITVQTHPNIVAVASLLEVGCIIIPEAIEVEPNTCIKAEQEGIPILSTDMNGFELSGKLYNLLREDH
jgi:serine kinase of HPr protein (carbohydrate metabolism regulator)